MKEYKFSEASKKYMRKQLANSILLTSLLLVISIGMFLKQSIFYGRFLLAFSIIGIIVTVIVTRKIRTIDDLIYIKLYKDRFELNNNVSTNPKILYFNDINKATLSKKGIMFYAGKRDYRILSSFLEKVEIDELWKKFSKYS
ncbi:hypothetical protein [Clostridium sp.]|uniref:hypothetical protein n=1 Tax=Clostridium sp. TaxID=1506 RepID=UPI0032180B33